MIKLTEKQVVHGEVVEADVVISTDEYTEGCLVAHGKAVAKEDGEVWLEEPVIVQEKAPVVEEPDDVELEPEEDDHNL